MRSLNCVLPAVRAQWTQQKTCPSASTPCPTIRQLQCGQTGASAWIAHSKLSNVWCFPPTITSNALSYSFSQTSHVAIHKSFARRCSCGGVRFICAVQQSWPGSLILWCLGLLGLKGKLFSFLCSYSLIWKLEIALGSDSFLWQPAMKVPKQLIDCLNENKVTYEILHHPEAVTAQRIAQAEHVKGRHHAKVVMVKSGEDHLMTVLPADHQIDLEKVEKVTGKTSSLDKEEDFKCLFPDCAIGAMPPFGNLMVCQPLWIRLWRNKTTSCSKRARTQ